MDNAIYLGMLPLSPRVASEPLYLDICKECLTATGWEGAAQDISLVHYPKQYVYMELGLWEPSPNPTKPKKQLELLAIHVWEG